MGAPAPGPRREREVRAPSPGQRDWATDAGAGWSVVRPTTRGTSPRVVHADPRATLLALRRTSSSRAEWMQNATTGSSRAHVPSSPATPRRGLAHAPPLPLERDPGGDQAG